MIRIVRRATALGFAAVVLVTSAPAAADPVEDAYIAGYATAVLERQLAVTGSKVIVKDGVATVEVRDLARSDREKITAAISRIPGVVRVEVVQAPSPPPTAAAPTPPARPTPTPAGIAVEAEVPPRGVQFLPEGSLFAPLIADPRWPHFSIVYQRYLDDPQLGDVLAFSLGDTFGLLRTDIPFGGQWELGFQAGIFSIFDLDSGSSDLVNIDYIVGIPVSYRVANFSALARVYHQSSHLGDEFLLRNRVDRINLSFEVVDLRLSYEVTQWLRVYGGAGYAFRRDPVDLGRWSTQFGLEVRSPWTIFGKALRPIAAVDVQHREQNDWNNDLSLRAGIQFETLPILKRKLQLMLEYFRGRSPNGQFYRDEIEYLGLGVHLYLF